MGKAGRRIRYGAALTGLATLLVAAASAQGASLCAPGAGAGQCSEPLGLAVDGESGRLYVADKGNNRVDAFDSADHFLPSFAGSGASALSSPTSLAVDGDPLSPLHHDVYVVDFGHRRIELFEPDGTFVSAFGEGEYSGSTAMFVAVGLSGQVLVADSGSAQKIRLREYGPGGGTPLREAEEVVGQEEDLAGFAVELGGDLYIREAAGGSEESLCKYDSVTWEAVSCFAGVDAEGVRAIATNGGGDLFTGGLDSADTPPPRQDYRVIAEYDAAGNALRRFGYWPGSEFINGLAARSGGEGPAYASIGGEVRIVPFPKGPQAAGPGVGGLTSFKAGLHVEVNPEGKATQYHFQYLTQADYIAQGNSFEGPATIETEPGTLPAGTRLARAQGLAGCPDPETEANEGKCLAPETEYRWRIIAINPDSPPGEPTILEGAPFTTTPPLEILAVWPTEVGTDAAALHAQVNPYGAPASGHFEYVSEASYEADRKAGGDGFAAATRIPGEGELHFGVKEGATATATATGLAEGAAYRFRVVVTNPLLEEALVGEEHRAFATLAPSRPLECAEEGAREGLAGARSGEAAFLPDCRAYEMVSPVDKNGGDIVYLRSPAERAPASLEQSSSDGSRMAYTSLTPFAGPEGAPVVSQYLAERRAGESWATHDVSSPRGRLLTKAVIQIDTEFEAFSPDLCSGWLRTVADPSLASGAPEGTLNLYRRSDELCGGKAYEAITTAPAEPSHHTPSGYSLELQGASADGSRTIYRANDTLKGSGAPPEPGPCATSNQGACQTRLYSRSVAEGTRYVCILPNHSPAPSCVAGTSASPSGAQRDRTSSLTNAISADGTRIFWSSPGPGEGAIYMSDSKGTAQASDDTTIPVSEAGEALSGTSKSRYWCAAVDGSATVFTTGGELYEFLPTGKATRSIAGEVVGLAGCSHDASRVYFASKEAIPGAGKNSEKEEASDGQPNLYLYEAPSEGGGGTYAFIGTLTDSDLFNPGGELGPVSALPTGRLSRVAPDGRTLAFMSAAPLTGFDNTDAGHGGPDMELFLYQAGSRKLSCASCSPTGTRPVGLNVSPFKASPVWVAGSIPPWENPLYAARALSDDGQRLFFATAERLVARDTDGRGDVYQWEAPGEGACTVSVPSYSPRNEGCLDLISSGRLTRDAEFRDASPNGDDVFFATSQSLLPQDPGLVDIYDARVGGGLPVPQPPPPSCEGEACQSQPLAPEAPTPASSAFRGPGNQPVTRHCANSARKARWLARNAAGLRRAAKGASSRRLAAKARGLSRAARRCRHRAGGQGRARR